MQTYIIRSRAVFTGNGNVPEPAALLIEGKRIKKVLDYAYDTDIYGKYPLYDYGDKLVMPAFLDTHTHIFTGAVAASPYVCDELGTCTSQEACVQMIRQFAEQHPDYKRIRGTGWFVGNWNDAPLPDRRSLDVYFLDIPVYLQCADAHSMWLNTAALEEAGIEKKELPDGIIGTFENGTLSGLLLEPSACAPAMEKYMEFTKEEQLTIHRNFQKQLAANGICAVSEMFADDYTPETYEQYDILTQIEQSDEMCAHVYMYTKLFGYTDFERFKKMRKHYEEKSRYVHIAGVKGFVDGVTETYTGLLLEPYEDRPDSCGEGLPLWPKERMVQEIKAANAEGIQVRLHCIADGSVRMALDMYEEAAREHPGIDVRNTIEHIENIHPDDLARFRELSVVPSMQPYHLVLSNGDKILRIGRERCKYEWPMKSVREAAKRLAIGTDYPVVRLNPFATIYAAVTRRNEAGRVVCQNVSETMQLSDVLTGYTKDSAYVYHCEDEMGTLEEGRFANLIVLSQNLFEILPEEILKTHVEVTYFEGRKVYKEENES